MTSALSLKISKEEEHIFTEWQSDLLREDRTCDFSTEGLMFKALSKRLQKNISLLTQVLIVGEYQQVIWRRWPK